MSSSQRYLTAVAALIAVNFIWGFNIPIIKQAVEQISPFTFNTLRSIAGSLVLLPFGLKAGLISDIRVNWKTFIVGGLLGIVATQTASAFALILSPGAIVAVIAAVGPVLLMFLAALLLNERMARLGWVGVVLAFIGILLVLGLGSSELGVSGWQTVLGALVMLCGLCSFYMFQITAKQQLVDRDPISMATGATLFGTGMLAMISLVEIVFWGQPFEGWDSGVTGGVIYAGILTQGVAFLTLTWGLKQLEGSRVGGIAFIHPAVGVFGSWVILGEQPGLSFFMGVLLVFVGVYLVTRSSIRRQEGGPVVPPDVVEAEPI